MDKTNLILDLVKEGKISNEQAKILLDKEERYVYYPISYPTVRYPDWVYPYNRPIVTYGSWSSAATTPTFTSSN